MKKTIVNERPAHKQSQRVKDALKINTQSTTTGRIPSSEKALSNKPKPAHFDSVQISGVVLDVEALKSAVRALNTDVQKELLDFIAMQLQNKKQNSAQDRKLNLFTNALSTELGKALGQSNRLFPLPLITNAKKMFKDVEVLMNDLKMTDLNTQDTAVMYGVLARVLVQQAETVSARAKIPLSMKLVLQTTTPLHALVDINFPGYIRAGLMMSVVIAKKSGISSEDDEDE